MIIVVTGNIGCGKSTVAKYLAAQLPNGQLFDYDQMVRDHYEHDENFTLMVAAVMGTYDKAEISNIVFNDRSKLQILRAATRPFTDAAIIKFIAKNQRSPMVLDIPLWYEDEMYDRFGCDFVIAVAADEETQLQRVKERSGWSEEKTLSVMANQLPQAIKVDQADYVVSNMRNISMLYAQVDYFVETFKLGTK